jgi:ABC-type multidrug transport system ATPase subunit
MALPPAKLPLLEIKYNDLSFHIKTSQTSSNAKIPTVGSTLAGIVGAPVALVSRRCAARASPASSAAPSSDALFPVLDGASGVLRPGTLTLLLAPPGHGKSSLMKALTQQLHGADVKGTIHYSGLAAKDAKGIHLGSLCQYVGQVDEHLPQLTVRETLEFVHENCSVDPAAFGAAPTSPGGHAGRVQDVIDLLHLGACQHTVIGNDLVRGVSGGEKKRVTVAEGLLSEARFLALDEISTGLDSAVTFDIVKRLRSRASDNGLTVLVSLLQPTPETYALFDEVLLMREGAVVYHGARAALPAYFAGLGFTPPPEEAGRGGGGGGGSGGGSGGGGSSSDSGSAAATAPNPSGLDFADWVLAMLSDPTATQRSDAAARLRPSGSEGDLRAAAAEEEGDAALPTSTAALAAAWRGSAAFAAQMALTSAPPLALDSPLAVALYSKGHVHGGATHLGVLLRRQWKLMVRNMLYMRSRVASAAIMSIVLGGLYYQRSAAQAPIYFGTFLNSLMIMGFSNMSEMSAGAFPLFKAAPRKKRP